MKHENCIVVTVNEAGFEYDIHSLVKAFYPACDVKVVLPFQNGENKENIENDSSSLGLPGLNIEFTKDAILLSLIDGENGRASFGAKKIKITYDMPRPQVKNCLKQLIYAELSQYTGKELPWGTLTGIRPTKIPMSMLEEGQTDTDIMKYMKDTYFISEKKGELAIQIARREKALLETLHYEDG